MVDLIEEFTIGPEDVQVALVLFSLEATVEWGLTEYTDKAALQQAILDMRYLRSWTNLNDALKLTHEEVYKPGNGVREGALRVTIILTDGVDNIPEEGTPLTLENAQQCKDDDIWLIAVGVTDGVDEDRLKQITSPIDYYFVDDFDTLPIIAGDLKDQICGPYPGDFFFFFVFIFIFGNKLLHFPMYCSWMVQSLQFAEKVTYVQVRFPVSITSSKFFQILNHFV